MPTLGSAYLSDVLRRPEPPCVSVYMPTHRTYPDVQQDRIRFKNLIRAVEDGLAKTHPGHTVRAVTDKLHHLQDDSDFWATGQDGLAVLASPSRFDVFKLPRTVPERAEVGETFHVKPLLRHVQSADRFHVLCVSRERVALFEGNRYELHPIEVPGVPLTANNRTADNRTQLAPGQGSPAGDILPDIRQFYHTVDCEVTNRLSNPTGLPVVLVGVEENLSEFRHDAKNPHLLPDAVSGDWTHWTLHEIREKAWVAFQKRYDERLAQYVEAFGMATGHNRGTADLKEAAAGAAAGRIDTLLVDADRSQPGSLEMTTGAVRPAGPADTQPGDMLDDLAELAMRNGARVVVVPAERMPTKTGLAATFRY